jgi:hypothetical protein
MPEFQKGKRNQHTVLGIGDGTEQTMQREDALP